MHGKAAGAPLRAIGALAVLWIFARIVISHVPENTAAGPGQPMTSEAAIRDNLQGRSQQLPDLAKLHFSVPTGARLDASGKPGTSVFSGIEPGPDDSKTLVGSCLTRGCLSTVRQDSGGPHLSPTELSARSGRSDSANGQHSLPSQYLSRAQRRNRLRGYFWLFARQDTDVAGRDPSGNRPTISNGQYGGSQMGALLSHPVWSRSGAELSIYGRLTAALAPLAQEEIAFGGTIQPARNIPLALHMEQRLDVNSGGSRGTAFYVSGGTGPDKIVENVVLETYVQAGYILREDETYFFDGAASLQRPIAESGERKLHIGAGMWAGGQRNITRLDVGPRAGIEIPVANATAHIDIDWRTRIAGDARPGNGLAITVSTSF